MNGPHALKQSEPLEKLNTVEPHTHDFVVAHTTARLALKPCFRAVLTVHLLRLPPHRPSHNHQVCHVHLVLCTFAALHIRSSLLIIEVKPGRRDMAHLSYRIMVKINDIHKNALMCIGDGPLQTLVEFSDLYTVGSTSPSPPVDRFVLYCE